MAETTTVHENSSVSLPNNKDNESNTNKSDVCNVVFCDTEIRSSLYRICSSVLNPHPHRIILLNHLKLKQIIPHSTNR